MTPNSREMKSGAWAASYAKSFFMMAAMNGERAQNIGFAFAVCPLLKCGDKIGARHSKGALEFFNTNPYLAPTIVGAVGRMEADGRSWEEIRTFKREMMGPFGAIGDSLFWFAMKPLAALVGVLLALLSGPVAAIAGTLICYNPAQIAIRTWGFFNGVRHGKWVVSSFTKIPFARICGLLCAIGALALGAVAAALARDTELWQLGGLKPLFATLLMGALVIGVSVINENSHRPGLVFYTASVATALGLYLVG